MDKGLTLRSPRLDDLDALGAMYTHIWGDYLTDPADKALVGRYNVLIQLVRSPLALVAELDGAIVGVCLGCRIKDGEVPVVQQWVPAYELERAKVLERSKTAGERLNGELFCDEYELRLADRLVAAGDAHAEAQLTLFLVEPWVTGRGVGTQLFERMRTMMREAGARRFFLMTDTGSNFAYYEHRGLKLLHAFHDEVDDLASWDRESWAFLVYGGTLGK